MDYDHFFFIFITTTLLVTRSVAQEDSNELCKLASSGSFKGQLTSLTWEVSQSNSNNYLLIMLNQTGYRINKATITKESMTPESEPNATSYSIDFNHLKQFTQSNTGNEKDNLLLGYSTLRELISPEVTEDIVYFQTKELFLRWSSRTNEKIVVKRKDQKLKSINFAIIHDQGPENAYAFGIDDAPGYRFFPIKNSKTSLPKGGLAELTWKLNTSFGYYPIFEKGHLHLIPNFNKVSGTSFKSLPQGTIHFESGMLYLLDDALGCVYAIEHWGRLDLLASSQSGGDLTMKFKATGIPYELFFICPANKSGSLSPDRCDISKSPFTLSDVPLWVWYLAGLLLIFLPMFFFCKINWFSCCRKWMAFCFAKMFLSKTSSKENKDSKSSKVSFASAVSADTSSGGSSSSFTSTFLPFFNKSKHLALSRSYMTNKKRYNSLKSKMSKSKKVSNLSPAAKVKPLSPEI